MEMDFQYHNMLQLSPLHINSFVYGHCLKLSYNLDYERKIMSVKVVLYHGKPISAFLFEPHRDKTNKMAYAPSEDSDQPGHPPILIRVFAVRMKKA